jgi:formylglycine-generating enzyme required for sulfatase activity
VSKSYLKNWEELTATQLKSGMPVAYVSYPAAKAYCSWLQTQLPQQLSDYTVRLPKEYEWEWASRAKGTGSRTAAFFSKELNGPRNVTAGSPNEAGVRDLLGNLWEWCEDWYHPNHHGIQAGGLDTGVEKVVRGGSWANTRGSVDQSTRASQPPDWCTQYLGFRPVLIKE